MAARVISADSHMMEPADLWTERLDRKFGDRTPRVMKIEGKPGFSFVAPGVRPFPVSAGFGIGKSGQELKEHLQKGYEAARPSGWDPAERLKDQDIDGVAAEVIYTTLGMPLFGLDDAELQRACFRVYNDWVAEFRSYDPKRLHPVALISLEDIGEAVKELERAAKIGLKSAMIWAVPPHDRPYYDPSYEPFWAAAQANDVPLSLHVITEKGQGAGDNQERVHTGPRLPGSVRILMGTMAPIHSIQRTLSSLLFGGVLEKFPRLRIVSAENDSGWVAHFMYRLDHFYEKFGSMSDKVGLTMKPSDYLRRQLWVTFQDDIIGPMTWKFFGENNFMWASDFPHTDSTWPHSLEVIEKDFAGVPEPVKQKIVCDNAARLYHIELN
ncbi:MAG TPA: amidohydrolase family protein [Candidatus Binataceae bacterium]